MVLVFLEAGYRARKPTVRTGTEYNACEEMGRFGVLTSEPWKGAPIVEAFRPPCEHGPEPRQNVDCANKVEGDKAMWRFLGDHKPTFGLRLSTSRSYLTLPSPRGHLKAGWAA